MSKCFFCGSKEDKKIPLCQTCGALRYPIDAKGSSRMISNQKKLKYSAIAAITLLTPGSFIVLALVGASQFSVKKGV